MDKTSINPASEVDVAPVIGSHQEPSEKGKREAEDAIEKDVVSAKKQKVEEEQSEVKNGELVKEEIANYELDTSASESEQQMKVCAMEGQAGSVSGEGSSHLEEDASAAKKKPAVAENCEHLAVPKKRDESSDDSDSSYEDETNKVDDFVATKRIPGSLANEGPVAPAKKTDGSNEDRGSSDEDEANEGDDIAAAKEDHTTPNTKKSRVSTQDKDDSESNERTRPPLNAATAEKTDAAPTNMDPENATNSKKKDESINDDECFDEDDVTTKNISAPVTNKKEQPYEESEFGNKRSADPKTNAAPKERTSGPKTLYVGNLSFSVEREDVEHFFEAAGEIVGIRFGMNPDESFKGYGFVEFSSPEAAEKALHELNGKELLHRRVKLDLVRERGSYTPYSSSKEAQSFQDGGRAQGYRIFVCGFNKNAGEDKIRSSLKEHFGSCGEITRVSIPTDQDGAFKGIAFIHFKDSDACTRALEINGSEFGGSTLSVEEARPRHDSCDSFQSGGGRGWRSGGWGFGGRCGGRGFGRGGGLWYGSGGGRGFGRGGGRGFGRGGGLWYGSGGGRWVGRGSGR